MQISVQAAKVPGKPEQVGHARCKGKPAGGFGKDASCRKRETGKEEKFLLLGSSPVRMGSLVLYRYFRI